jgi:hypothetical protein
MSVLPELASQLDPELNRQIRWRVEALARHARFLTKRESEDMLFVRSRGWTDERLHILYELNSFYQIVLAPLASATRIRSDIGLGRAIPIRYGHRSFDAEYAKEVDQMMRAFMARMRRSGISQRILAANRADDLVAALAVQLKGYDKL